MPVNLGKHEPRFEHGCGLGERRPVGRPECRTDLPGNPREEQASIRSNDARDLLRVGFAEAQGDRMKAAGVDREIEFSAFEWHPVHARHTEVDVEPRTKGARRGDLDRGR